MKDFEFQIPTKIIFGRDTVSRIGVEAKAYGKTVMFVYGKSSIKRSGIYDRVIKSLREAGLKIVEFPGVKPNPVLSHLHMGVELAKKEKVEFILGVGGGSVLDEAKAIAAGVMTEGCLGFFQWHGDNKRHAPCANDTHTSCNGL